VTDANNAIKDIECRGKLPIFVGGTLLYYKVYAYGIFEGVERDEEFRTKLEAIAQEKGNLYLYNELKKVDSNAAEKINPNDLKRIIRALEVFTKTGMPISSLHTHFNKKAIFKKG
jgi:tRNA dimethylallyltransferase